MLPMKVVSNHQNSAMRSYPVRYIIYLALLSWTMAKAERRSQGTIFMPIYKIYSGELPLSVLSSRPPAN